MDEKTKKQIELHTAGATVRHKNPFEELVHYKSELKVDKEFAAKWIVPFYMWGINDTEKFLSDYLKIKPELNINIVKQLLGDFNWRTRITGAYFASIENYTELEEIIGIHLLKSQVCYAGGGYCLALATFNTEKSYEYIKKYLDYYLTRKDLHFEQREAMATLKSLDIANGTNEMEKYLPKYTEWVNEKYSQNIETSIEHYNKQMNALIEIREKSR
ncbi:DUF6000 family protein [Aquimarina algiphila]|uniref:DUF6000 family protein n=1 Tax=Aquimarina algiphila TaxID=2047982 RepID=UPI00232EA81A|nr:DUF6000 family protein [Aquimarina algiphila]